MGKTNSEKPTCKYGAQCYRKNPQHRKDYSHPDDIEDRESSPPPKRKKTIAEFFAGSKPDHDDDVKSENDSEDVPGDVAKASTSKEETANVEESEDNGAKDSSDVDDDSDVEEQPESPNDVKESIKQKFLVEMPQDFYDFWDFAKSLNKESPSDAFQKSLGLELVGPFDVLGGNTKSKSGKKVCWLRHWRYFYDPPEFLTVLKGDNTSMFHMGYFRDDPSEVPAFVASNAAAENCNIRPRGENLFAALVWFIDDAMKNDNNKKETLSKLKEKVKKFAEMKNYPLESKTKGMKDRDKKVVTRSFHAAGIVVPVDANEVGYRELPESDGDLKKMFKKIAGTKTEKERDEAFDPLMEVIMLVQFANDECDYGEGLELGIDMFCSGHKVLHGQVLNLMPLAYELLKRQPYAKIIKAHLKNRRFSADVSQLL